VSAVVCVIVPCLCNEDWGVSRVVYVILQDWLHKSLLTYLILHYINTGQHKTLLTHLKLHYINTGNNIKNEVWGMSGVICVIVPCLSNDVWGMSSVFCAFSCLCNEVWGVSGVICAVSCLCNEVWGMSGVICVIFPCLCNYVWTHLKLHYINKGQ
jgi:hypothetical protein